MVIAIRQNPAYRPTPDTQNPLQNMQGVLPFPGTHSMTAMRISTASCFCIIAAIGTLACSSRIVRGPSPGAPGTQPSATLPPIEPSASSWTFRVDPRPHRYQLTSIATIKLQTVSSEVEDTTSSTIAFTLLGGSNYPTETVSGEITEISIQTGSRIGRTNRRSAVSIPFSINWANHQLVISEEASPSSVLPCTDTMRTYTSRIPSQLNAIPSTIQRGLGWRDSTAVTGCQGLIPLEINLVRNYHVVGETRTPDESAILIHRSDSTHTSGEGSQGQHRISIEGTGSGQARILLDRDTGQLINAQSEQLTRVLTRVSGREATFVQQTKETIRLVR